MSDDELDEYLDGLDWDGLIDAYRAASGGAIFDTSYWLDDDYPDHINSTIEEIVTMVRGGSSS